MILWYETYEDENAVLPLERSNETFMPEKTLPKLAHLPDRGSSLKALLGNPWKVLESSPDK